MQKDERRQRKIVLGITAQRAWKLLITFVIGLLIGRIHIQQTIYPFGMAYMLAAYRYNRKINPYMAAGGVFAEMALNSSQMQQPVYYVSVIAVCAALLLAAGGDLLFVWYIGIPDAYVIGCGNIAAGIWGYGTGDSRVGQSAGSTAFSEDKHLYGRRGDMLLFCGAALRNGNG